MIDEGLRIHEYITDGEAIAIVGQECDGDRVLKRNMWLVENGQQRLIKKAGIEGDCGWPKMGSRFITWTTSGKAYAYDRKKDYIVKMFDEYKSYAELTNNNYIVWSTQTEEERRKNTGTASILNIVEIDDIP